MGGGQPPPPKPRKIKPPFAIFSYPPGGFGGLPPQISIKNKLIYEILGIVRDIIQRVRYRIVQRYREWKDAAAAARGGVLTTWSGIIIK